nr:hypothetical protein Iba_chr03cCG7110 [Ipomoea batatas]
MTAAEKKEAQSSIRVRRSTSPHSIQVASEGTDARSSLAGRSLSMALIMSTPQLMSWTRHPGHVFPGSDYRRSSIDVISQICAGQRMFEFDELDNDGIEPCKLY